MAKKKSGALRKTVQILWALLSNGYIAGYTGGKIYQGPLKQNCVPGLNCYSCPGALGSCPIGAMQSVATDRNKSFSFTAAGYVMAFGALCGRFVCGWLCPFGLIQELLYLLFPKHKIKTFRGDRYLRWLKYAVLAVFVFLLPAVIGYGATGDPWFCKYICPAGTLEGGIPLALLNDAVAASIGGLFFHKLAILLLILALAVVIYRPFCRYLCPLGAIYALFNNFALVRMTVDEHKCVNCGACERACPMACPVRTKPNDPECVRCGACERACPTGALHVSPYIKLPHIKKESEETK